MSSFNPNPQAVQEEDFRSFSHPISPVEGNKALGTALTGVGQAMAHSGEFVKDIGKVQEFNTRQSIENSPELKSAGAAREQSIAAYENFYNQTTGDKELQTSLNAPNANINLIDPNARAESLPTDLRSLPQLTGTLASAKLDTKINQVLLTAEVDRQAKSLRARFPDHTDYIDHEFSRAGFGNTANSKLQALQQYYLAANAGKDEELKTAIAYARAHPTVPNSIMDPLLDRLHQGDRLAIGLVERAVRAWETPKEILHRSLDNLDADNKFSADSAKKSYGDFLAGMANARIQTAYDVSGFGSLQAKMQEVNDLRLHPEKVNPVSLQLMVQQLRGMKEEVDKYASDILYQPALQKIGEAGPAAYDRGTGRTGPNQGPVQPVTDEAGRTKRLVTMMGPNGASEAKAMRDATFHVYDELIDAIQNKDWGLATHIPHMLEATTDAQIKSMMSNPNLGKYLSQLKALVSINPQYGEKYFTANYPEAATAIQAWIKDQKLSQIQSGKPIVESFQTLADYGISNQAAQHLIDGVQDIWKSPKEGGLENDDSKRMSAKSFFADANKGLLKFFPEDRYEQVGSSVRKIPGRMSIFQNLTDPRAAAEFKRLGGETWDMYKRWTVDAHRDNIFNNQLRIFESFPEDYKKLDFAWDDKSGHFLVKINQSKEAYPGMGARTPYRIPPAIQGTLNEVNKGLDSLNEIAKLDGHSPTVYTLQALKELNFQFEGFAGIPKELYRSIQKSTSTRTFPSEERRTNEKGQYIETPDETIARLKKKIEDDKKNVEATK